MDEVAVPGLGLERVENADRQGAGDGGSPPPPGGGGGAGGGGGGGPAGNGPAATAAGALTVVAIAIIAVLTAFHVVDWTAAEATLAGAEATTAIALVTAVVAHLLPQTRKEPVAIAGAATAWLTATLELVNGFGWWVMTPDQETSLVALVAAIAGLGTAVLARWKTSPI